jgi:hypothetical protein
MGRGGRSDGRMFLYSSTSVLRVVQATEPHTAHVVAFKKNEGVKPKQKSQWGKNVYLLSKRNASCTLQINYSPSRPFSPRLFQFTIKSWLSFSGRARESLGWKKRESKRDSFGKQRKHKIQFD